MLENLLKYDILLASNSPRRKELLAGLDIKYRVAALPDIDESYPEELSCDLVAEYISQKKALAYSQLMKEDSLIITADTVVVCENDVLGKPADSDDAKRMLRQLSGKTHKVITGVTIRTVKEDHSFSSISLVTFAELSDSEIDYYIEKYKPFDKAGSYGVQEWIGYIGVEKIEGSYFNVMGLPIQRVYSILKLIE